MVGKETTIYNRLDFHMQNLQHCNVNYVQQGKATLCFWSRVTPLTTTWAKLSKYHVLHHHTKFLR